MPVDDIKPSEAMRHYIGNEQEQSKHHPTYGSFQGKHKYPSPKRGTNDVTSFMNIPQDELTPAVTEAIVSLMEEIDQLRHELDLTHGYEKMLSSSIDKHTDLPVLTRHALMREVMVLADRAKRNQTTCTFVYFQIRNFADIKKRFGLLCSDAVLREVAQVLKNRLRETDRIGTLGGEGFGIFMALSDKAHAEEKIKELSKTIEQTPVFYDGLMVDVKIAYGLYNLEESEDAKTILDGADKDLRSRFVTL